MSDKTINLEQQREKIRQMEQQKMMSAKVSQSVKEKLQPETHKKNPLDMMKYINGLSKQQEREQPKEKPLTPKEIEAQLKVQQMIKEQQEEELEKLLAKEEVIEIKEGVVHALSYPHFHPVKRKLFHNRLMKSEIVDDYLNHSFVLQYFNSANRHLKFALAYGLNYFRTNDDFDNLLLLQQMRQQQPPQQQEEKTEEKTDEKTETSSVSSRKSN
ncbi:MAG: hypothetical protein Q8J97_11840 [Flavobacteriaceae bacterium]|nr:hypothetical protein [Flavobacteriaceae bacterium]